MFTAKGEVLSDAFDTGGDAATVAEDGEGVRFIAEWAGDRDRIVPEQTDRASDGGDGL